MTDLRRLGDLLARPLPSGRRALLAEQYRLLLDATVNEDAEMANTLPDRDARILDAALELARGLGYQWITRDQVADAAGVSPGTINNAFGTMVGLKRAVLAAAVEREVVEIVAQGLADGKAECREAPAALQQRAFDHMRGASA